MEYLYGFGGCVCKEGDSSGDEEEEAIVEERGGVCMVVQVNCGAQRSWGLLMTTTNTCQPHSAIPALARAIYSQVHYWNPIRLAYSRSSSCFNPSGPDQLAELVRARNRLVLVLNISSIRRGRTGPKISSGFTLL